MQTLVNSQVENINADAISISDSSMQIVGSRFTNNAGSTAGGLTISGNSSVLIDSTQFANNSGVSGAALVVSFLPVIAIESMSSFEGA